MNEDFNGKDKSQSLVSKNNDGLGDSGKLAVDRFDSKPQLEPSFGMITEGESNRSLYETLKLALRD